MTATVTTGTGQRHLQRLLEREDHDAFVRALDPLCHREAGRVATNGLEHDDLVQEARVACLRAARAWNPNGGANPLTLAILCIRRDLWKLTRQQLNAKRAANLDTLSLNAPAGPHQHGTLGEAMPAPDDVTEHAEHALRLAQAAQTIDRLSNRDRDLARAVLLNDQPIAQAAQTAGVSRQRADQIIHRVRRALTTAPRENGVLLIDRAVHPTEHDAIREARRVRPDCTIHHLTKRKVRKDGRVTAPQGRPDRDGNLGRPVWAIHLTEAA